jgi:putative transcriptional regulator
VKTRRAAWCAVFAAALVLALAVWCPAPADIPAWPAPAASLAGQLLVALPELEDPRFTRTVIYMVKDDPRAGATGLIVNRPLGEIPIAVLMRQSALPPTGAQGSVRLHVGGPVEPTRISVLHSNDYKGPDTTLVAGGIAVTAQPEILEAIAAGKGPRRARFAMGYAGWAPGQLEAEIKGGYWVAVPSDDAILFDDAYETKWDRAMAKRRINL